MSELPAPAAWGHVLPAWASDEEVAYAERLAALDRAERESGAWELGASRGMSRRRGMSSR